MKKIFTLIAAAIFATTTFAQEDRIRVRVHTNDGKISGFMLSDIDSLTFAKKQVVQKETLTIKTNEVTPTSASYTITPSSDDFKYYQFIVSQSTYDLIMSQYSGSLFNHDKAWWEAQAEYSGATWKDILKQQVTSGTQTFESASIISSLKPKTRYCVYAYGIDTETAEMTTDIVEYWFETPDVAMSDNVLEIVSVTPEVYAFTVNVTATNNDPYVVTYQRASSFNNLVAQEGSEEAAIDKMIDVQTSYGGYGSMVHNGSQTVRLENLDSNTEYVILAFGYDSGKRTTEYKKYLSTTDEP
ncbi:MAG: hypothetical protein SOZ80_08895 [Prevotella sp.]|uniref:hypothetical protein n=1 Tax=Prevotella sp. TaxID=59823 RepID=UPI002A2C7EC7|nr:hypothetical protein [Prevotella sp.]MDD7318238.1 hypothetical protein [Prevotellaceae bacterium]MDY4020873.1 hypothetical protein [Prevotella sp.]